MIDYFLATSNKEKVRQYHKFGCTYPGLGGPDLKEPDASASTIVAYKALENGPGAVVEDTCLHIENCPYNGNLIRFIEDTLDDYIGEKAIFEVALGRNNGKDVEIFIAKVHGRIVPDESNGKAYGFDGYFIADGSTETLYTEFGKDNFSNSARKLALKKMINNDITCSVPLEKSFWHGPWQESDIVEYNKKTKSIEI